MRLRLSSIIAALFAVSTLASAQSRTIILNESDRNYTSQNWFYAGAGKPLQENKIRENWDSGRKITSLAYTSKGWFVVMSKNSGISTQRYKVSLNWPKDWIRENWDSDYYISQVSCGYDEWVVVMSKGEGYTNQSWKRDTWSQLRRWIVEKWEQGKFITSLAFDGQKWVVVMSKHSKYAFQGYFWAKTHKDLIAKVKHEVWDRHYSVHAIEYGDGGYICVYGAPRVKTYRRQDFEVNPSNIKNYISAAWANDLKISYLGGSAPVSDSGFEGLSLPGPASSTEPPVIVPAAPAPAPQPQPGHHSDKPGHQGAAPGHNPGQPGSQQAAPEQRHERPSGSNVSRSGSGTRTSTKRR